jgi:hypothetical protein
LRKSHPGHHDGSGCRRQYLSPRPHVSLREKSSETGHKSDADPVTLQRITPREAHSGCAPRERQIKPAERMVKNPGPGRFEPGMALPANPLYNPAPQRKVWDFNPPGPNGFE